jgi:hypothetical protein
MCIRFLAVILSVATQISQASPVSSVEQKEKLALQIVESRQNELFPASRNYIAVLTNSGKGSAAIEAVQMPGGYAGSGRFYPCSLQFWNVSNHTWMTPRPAKLSGFGKKPSIIQIKLKPGEKLEVCNSLLPQQQGRVGDSVRFGLSLKWGHGPTLFSRKFTISGQSLSKDH